MSDDGERERNSTRPDEPFLHADMDAFYASVEQRDDPSLKGRPVVVGGDGSRGVVAAASYEARRYGVRSAMPMTRARRQCPNLVVMPARFDVYRDVSAQVMEIFQRYTPLVEPISLDEAFLDVGGSSRLFGGPVQIAQRIRAEIRDELDLPCSVGIGSSKFVAKLLSAKAKPDGWKHWPKAIVADELRPLPIGDLWGAGPKTVERLETYGFRTVGQLADTDLRTITRIVGEAMGGQLHRLARGIDTRRVTPHEGAKSVSASETFDVDVDDPDVLERRVLQLSEKVGRRMRAGDHSGRTVTLTVRFANFETITRSATVRTPTSATKDISDLALSLLAALRLERARVRLLGVGVTNLTDDGGARQLSLDLTAETPDDAAKQGGNAKWQDLERIADLAAEKFGRGAVGYAALLDDRGRDWADSADETPSADDLRRLTRGRPGSGDRQERDPSP